MSKHKSLGQVFTPKWIVKEILDLVGYNNNSILNKYILEPSSGDGIFLIEIVERYINEAQKNNWKKKQITDGLAKYIYGIELDTIEYIKCIENLNKLVATKIVGADEVDWKIFNENTLLTFKTYLSFFDYIVGNPPYIRIHNLDPATRELLKKEFLFSEGTIDIYLSFFEMSLKMINSTGIVGFITPNSYLHNTSYNLFREYLKNEKLVKTLIDFKANKIFKGFSTYTAITILQVDKNRKGFNYFELVDNTIKQINTVSFNNVSKSDWSFSTEIDTKFMENIKQFGNAFIKDYFDVQYGFATLRDKIYISKVENYDENLVHFNGILIEKNILKKIIKGSTFKGDISKVNYILFPYILSNGRFIPIEEKKLESTYPLAYKYLLKNKNELLSRDMDKGAQWYEFGRSQGVQSMHKEKIVVSTLVNGNMKFFKLPSDILIYSGIFITKKNIETSWQIIIDVLKSQDFFRYIRITGKDFSGGYKSVTSKQIKEFKIEIKNTQTLFSDSTY